MLDQIIISASGVWLLFGGTIYNISLVKTAVIVGGGLTRLTFTDGSTIDIPNALAKQIFIV